MAIKGSHLSLEERKIIEENICKGLRKFETAKEHALEETVLLELVIVVQKLKGVKKQNFFITQM